MLSANNELACSIALWPLDKEFYREETGRIHTQQTLFGPFDYYQEDLMASHKRCGYCSLLQEFLIQNIKALHFSVKNIYSSIRDEAIVDEGVKFWNSQVGKDKAEYIPSLSRYRLKIK